MEATDAEPVFDCFRAEPKRKQLLSCDDAMLPTHQLPDVF
jgi:hypothetical protein